MHPFLRLWVCKYFCMSVHKLKVYGTDSKHKLEVYATRTAQSNRLWDKDSTNFREKLYTPYGYLVLGFSNHVESTCFFCLVVL